jgi:hypothetical protein
MNSYTYRRVRKFCELSLFDMRLGTGLMESRIAKIETGRTVPNSVEKALIENFLRDHVRLVLEGRELNSTNGALVGADGG